MGVGQFLSSKLRRVFSSYGLFTSLYRSVLTRWPVLCTQTALHLMFVRYNAVSGSELIHSWETYNVATCVSDCGRGWDWQLDLLNAYWSQLINQGYWKNRPRNNYLRCIFIFYFAATCFGPRWLSSSRIHNIFGKLPHSQRIRCFVLI
jgi:hypothetical protein